MSRFVKPFRRVAAAAVVLVVIVGIGFVVNRVTGGGLWRAIQPLSMSRVRQEPHFAGTVTRVDDDAILVAVDAGEDARRSSDLIVVSLAAKLEESQTGFSPGDRVTVYYDGVIAESYPAQIHTVYAIVRTLAE